MTNINTEAIKNHEVPVMVFKTYVIISWGSYDMYLSLEDYNSIMEE